MHFLKTLLFLLMLVVSPAYGYGQTFAFATNEQPETRPHTTVASHSGTDRWKQEKYFFLEAEFGMMIVDADGLGVHGGIAGGYQFSPWLGLGLSFTGASALTSGASYDQGLGLRYRAAYKRLLLEADVGMIREYSISDDICDYRYVDGNYWFVSGKVGFRIFQFLNLGATVIRVPEKVEMEQWCLDDNGEDYEFIATGQSGFWGAYPTLQFCLPLF